jgi:hypothetical protein
VKALITAVLLTPAALQAQTLPGGSDIDDSKLVPDTWEVTVTLKRDGREMRAGSTRYELAELPGGRWAYITQTTSQLGTATDTSIARRGTLEPISHRSHAVPRTLLLEYEGRTVTGRHIPRDSAAREIAHVTERPTFDAAMLDVILRTLPLAPGYTTRLPMYIEAETGLTWFGVTVVGDTTVGTTDAWQVEVAVTEYAVSYLLAKDDHRLLAGRVQYPNGAVVEMTRTPTSQ